MTDHQIAVLAGVSVLAGFATLLACFGVAWHQLIPFAIVVMLGVTIEVAIRVWHDLGKDGDDSQT